MEVAAAGAAVVGVVVVDVAVADVAVAGAVVVVGVVVVGAVVVDVHHFQCSSHQAHHCPFRSSDVRRHIPS